MLRRFRVSYIQKDIFIKATCDISGNYTATMFLFFNSYIIINIGAVVVCYHKIRLPFKGKGYLLEIFGYIERKCNLTAE